jgi:hypothetical protein
MELFLLSHFSIHDFNLWNLIWKKEGMGPSRLKTVISYNFTESLAENRNSCF